MTDSTTTNYGWSYPTVNADSATWGATINTTVQAIDTDLKAVSDDSKSASNLSSGTLPDGRFPATLPAASGANLTALPAGNLSGTIAIANGGTGATTASAARTAFGLGAAALKNVTSDSFSTVPTVRGAATGNLVKYFDDDGTLDQASIDASDVPLLSNNGSDYTAGTFRTNIGLGSIATKNITVSTSDPSGTPAAGDVWLKYSA